MMENNKCWQWLVFLVLFLRDFATEWRKKRVGSDRPPLAFLTVPISKALFYYNTESLLLVRACTVAPSFFPHFPFCHSQLWFPRRWFQQPPCKTLSRRDPIKQKDISPGIRSPLFAYIIIGLQKGARENWKVQSKYFDSVELMGKARGAEPGLSPPSLSSHKIYISPKFIDAWLIWWSELNPRLVNFPGE